MGQLFLIYNLDKIEYLDPHKFREARGIEQFGVGAGRTLTALALLLAEADMEGSEWFTSNPVVGRWAGDRIVLAGDEGKLMTSGCTLYEQCRYNALEVSEMVKCAMEDSDTITAAASSVYARDEEHPATIAAQANAQLRDLQGKLQQSELDREGIERMLNDARASAASATRSANRLSKRCDDLEEQLTEEQRLRMKAEELWRDSLKVPETKPWPMWIQVIVYLIIATLLSSMLSD
ncbi:MAG TPA: hypothetical protein VK993_14975 [Chthoniobacterales bacterium]|nr:hypothetical protein [Chthoniobacterales bacterium]